MEKTNLLNPSVMRSATFHQSGRRQVGTLLANLVALYLNGMTPFGNALPKLAGYLSSTKNPLRKRTVEVSQGREASPCPRWCSCCYYYAHYSVSCFPSSLFFFLILPSFPYPSFLPYPLPSSSFLHPFSSLLLPSPSFSFLLFLPLRLILLPPPPPPILLLFLFLFRVLFLLLLWLRTVFRWCSVVPAARVPKSEKNAGAHQMSSAKTHQTTIRDSSRESTRPQTPTKRSPSTPKPSSCGRPKL